MSRLFNRRNRLRPLHSIMLGSWFVLAGGAIGCVPSMPPDPEETDTEASAVESPETATAQNTTADNTTAEAVAPAANEPRRAEVGVGRQGRSLDDETGVGRMIAQPAVSLFAVRERTVFEIQIPQALQLFEATEGRKPRSHEEFMQRIITANQIQLPELPAGSKYQYDSEKGELWVHPA